MLRKSDNIDKDEPEAYTEPNPDADEWPDHWTPKQRANWEQYGQEIYEALKTDTGRYWYRRTYRPKKRNEGMMKRDHVKLGRPEDYIDENVSDTLNPMGNMTSVMMRQISRYTVDRDELDDAVSDITQAKIKNMSDAQQARLASEAKRLANTYGLELANK